MTTYYSDEDEPKGSDSEDDSKLSNWFIKDNYTYYNDMKGNTWLHVLDCSCNWQKKKYSPETYYVRCYLWRKYNDKICTIKCPNHPNWKNTLFNNPHTLKKV